MKQILILFILIFFCRQGFSQGIRFSAFADPEIVWGTPHTSVIKAKGIQPGINFGFSMDKFFADNYAFNTGLSIHNFHLPLQYNDTTLLEIDNAQNELPEKTTVNYRLQYLKLPVALKFLTNEIGYTTFFAHMGLTTEMSIKSTADVNIIDTKEGDISTEVKLFIFSYHIGAGVEYSLGGSSALNFGLTYTSGFTDITTMHEKVTVNNVALRVGIIF
jgi:hypothetical protein